MIPIGPQDRVFVLTGAGISAESGIPTFRDANGLWKGYRFEEVASPNAWNADPTLVWEFYSMRREKAAPCKPNPAHLALAKLEQKLGKRFTLVTQNVDNLHEQAGSLNVIHMHGELFKSRCERCNRQAFPDSKLHREELPLCHCGAKIRPYICWFGEMPFAMDEIYSRLGQSTVFLCVGSSGVVYPAAGFVAEVRGRAKTYYIGPEEPANGQIFDRCFEGKAGELLPKLLSESSN